VPRIRDNLSTDKEDAMAEAFTTGSWVPNEGEEREFIAAWSEFAQWASTMPGARAVRLARDLRDPGRFVSFAGWDDLEAVRAWKGSDEFKPRMSRVQQHVDKFNPTELEVVAVFESGAARLAPEPAR
jgi:heme-degrading monooxygenase HmoA